MHHLEVGKPYLPGRRNWPETVSYNARSGGHEFRMFMNGLSPREIAAVRRGKIEFGLLVMEEVLFLLYRIEGFGPWSDVAYSWHLTNLEMPQEAGLPDLLPTREAKELLQIVLVDATSGLIQGLRVVTWSPEFSGQINAAIRDQAARPWIGMDAYQKFVSGVYASTSSEEMVRRAQVSCIGGE